MLYRILLFSVKPQHESAIGIHISSILKLPPFSLPIPRLSIDTKPLFEFPESYGKFPLAIYFTYGNINFHVTLSIHLTLSSPLPMSIQLEFDSTGRRSFLGRRKYASHHLRYFIFLSSCFNFLLVF